MSWSEGRDEVEQQHDDNDAQHGSKLAQHIPTVDLVVFEMLMALMLLLTLGLSATAWRLSEKHIVEEFFCVCELFIEVMATASVIVKMLGATATASAALL